MDELLTTERTNYFYNKGNIQNKKTFYKTIKS